MLANSDTVKNARALLEGSRRFAADVVAMDTQEAAGSSAHSL
jgi:hypothetical protein